jgi:uncharacterized protein (TIGR00730 family)
MKIISVFGSAATLNPSADYTLGEQIGETLAEAGYAVMTGGYQGMMAAVSAGAHRKGGHVIGVTTAALERLRPHLDANEWVREEVKYMTMHERLLHLVTRADGYVALPGGLGTVTEVMLTWELMRVGELPANPLVLYGDYWRQALASIEAMPYAQRPAWSMLSFADSPAEVVRLLGGNVNARTDTVQG